MGISFISSILWTTWLYIYILGKHSSTYPQTYGLSRKEVNSLIRDHVRIRPHIALKLSQFQHQHNLRINPLHSIPTSSHLLEEGTQQTLPQPKQVEEKQQQQQQELGGRENITNPQRGNSSSLCIAVHYRGTDTAQHYPYHKVDRNKKLINIGLFSIYSHCMFLFLSACILTYR